jgi:Zinc-finger associated domain (zf-AD)
MEEFSLKNHKNKCRLCFKTLNKRGKNVEITEDIENKFNSLTQVHLKNASNYSNKICANCNKELKSFVDFKTKIVQRQLKLYEDFPDDQQLVKAEPEIEILHINIKQEAEDGNQEHDFDDRATELDGQFDEESTSFNENLELLRDNMKELKEPVDESKQESILPVEKSKSGKRGRYSVSRYRGGPASKKRSVCPDCGELRNIKKF